jgi:hypothetical protein
LVALRQVIAGENGEHAEVEVLRNIMSAKGRNRADGLPIARSTVY